MKAFISSLVIVFGSLSVSKAEVLKATRTDWEFLLFKDASGVPVDPVSEDVDFHQTWQNPLVSGYDGPSFLTRTGPFRWGAVGGIPNGVSPTDLWDPDDVITETIPPAGSRNTVYFRTTLTPTEPVETLEFSGFFDDGVIIYLDGVEVSRFNMDGSAPDTWVLGALGNSAESTVIRFYHDVILNVGETVTLAVSLHNRDENDQDLGIDLRVNSVSSQVPANDDFDNAVNIIAGVGFTALGTTGDTAGGLGASKETGEPNHAGNPGGGSVWYTWSPPTTGRYTVSCFSSDFDPLLAVYTGDAVNDLTPVQRFPNMIFPASSRQSDEPFSLFARVEFDAVDGQLYRFAMDGENGTYGNFFYRVESTENPLDPTAELFPAGGSWEYLLAVDGAMFPIDPTSVDPDFHTTWFDPGLYDGPGFMSAAPAPLGSLGVEAEPIVTNVWAEVGRTPPLGLRYTTYYRTTFTPGNWVTRLGFEGIVDEGAIIYINGREVTRFNVDESKDAQDWQTLADGEFLLSDPSFNVEKLPQQKIVGGLNLPSGVPVDVALSLHNDHPDSVDIGFNLRMYALVPPVVPGNFRVTVSEGNSPNEYHLQWPSTPGEPYRVEFSVDLETWFPVTSESVMGDSSGLNELFDEFESAVGFYRVVAE